MVNDLKSPKKSAKFSNNPIKLVLIAGLLMLIVIFTLYFKNSTVPFGEKIRPFNELGGAFELQGLDGTVSSDDFLGKVVIMYFGYLSCTEICPPSMGIMSSAFKMLPDSNTDIQGVFISVDPARDDLESINQFTQYFDDRIIGLTDSEEKIKDITKQYGVYIEQVDMQSSVLSYSIDHMSRFYILDTNGNLIDSMSHTTTPIELAARIQRATESGQ